MGFIPILKRELFALLVTPLAWVMITGFVLVQGWHFALLMDHAANAQLGDVSPVSAFFGTTDVLYLVLFLFLPALTMRTFAEERRLGTMELLVTAPVSTWAMVLAKFLATFVIYVLMWAPTVLYLRILKRAGAELDPKMLAACYLGILLVGAAYLAIGILASTLTRSVFIALVLTAVFVLALFLAGSVEFVAREGSLSFEAAQYVSVWTHMNEFSVGVIDSRRIVFYVTLSSLSLFLSTRVVDTWRRG